MSSYGHIGTCYIVTNGLLYVPYSAKFWQGKPFGELVISKFGKENFGECKKPVSLAGEKFWQI